MLHKIGYGAQPQFRYNPIIILRRDYAQFLVIFGIVDNLFNLFYSKPKGDKKGYKGAYGVC
jgi:hypothetical protein